MKWITLISLILWFSVRGMAQQPHLEIGAKFGFKDEFHLKPSFNLNSKYTEIHYFDAYVFWRVSKRRFGNEFGLGFEKASDYFVRFTDQSKQMGYVNLNRVQVDLSQFFYLHKSGLQKWDVQVGLRNYFGFNERIWIPNEMELKTWKLTGRVSTNYTYKTFMVGVFYEYDLRTDYFNGLQPVVFGVNVGVVY